MDNEYDVIVVGAGPAGSTTARYAAKGGASVLLMEKRQEIGSPVRCGEGISKEFLPKVDVEPNPLWIATDIDGARLVSPSGHEFLVDESLAGDEVGYVIERDLFDRDMAYLAAKAGAEVVVKCTTTELLRDGGKIAGVKVVHNGEERTVRAKLVVGADGYESQIGRWAGIDTSLKTKDIMSCVQYRMTDIDANAKYCEFFIGGVAPGGYVWVFPKSDDTANVGIGVQAALLKQGGQVKGYLDKWIASQPRFKDGKVLDMVSGGVSVCAPIDQTVTDGLLLVGDAARMIDPMTGGGISNGCRAGKIAGQVAAEAVKANDTSAQFLMKYDKGWRDILEEKLYRNFMAKEKIAELSDDTFDKVIQVLADSDMEKINVFNILKVIKVKYPELVKEFEDLI
jgi:digeranylgeranylglycerophospholipid reductase